MVWYLIAFAIGFFCGRFVRELTWRLPPDNGRVPLTAERRAMFIDSSKRP